MKENKICENHSEFNSIIKENDEIYRSLAKEFGLSDCAFWILYSLRDSKKTLTQSEICNIIYQPKQTVNTALKKLESEGYILLSEMKDRRSKKIELTEKGEHLAEITADRVISAERKSFAELTEGEREDFLRIFRKYTEIFKINLKQNKEQK